MPPIPFRVPALATALALAGLTSPAWSQTPAQPAIRTAFPVTATYADLADLAVPARIVARAEVTKMAPLKPEQAPDVAPGHIRVYLEARTTAVLIGSDLGESLRFLADVPLDALGKAPKLRKTQVLLFAQAVPGRPGELRLVAPDAIIPATPEVEATTRSILTALVTPDAPPTITRLREALHVSGNLVGEGETQLFLATANGAPVSISILRRPGEPTRWGVSFTEIVDQSARPPAKDTLAWYRLACFLPPALPPQANLSGSPADRRAAAEDYALVLTDLGPCTRSRQPAG